MYILALESSGQGGSVAAAQGPRLIAQQDLNPRQRSAQSLASGIRQLLDAIGWKITDVELVAVTVGPGSFTGLRVGVVTAKTLAYALGASAIGLNTLDVIAAQACCTMPRVSVAIDAQRGQVFSALFQRTRSAVQAATNESPNLAGPISPSVFADQSAVHPPWQMIAGPHVLDNAQWLSGLEAGMAASGPALAKLAKQVPAGVTLIDERDWAPRAAAVAALAWVRHLQGATDDVWKLAPLYLRKSAAEEKLELKL